MLKLKNLEENIPLAPYTTYKIGGTADYFYAARSKNDLIQAVNEAKKHKTPFFILGLGANILVSDKGFRGLVIHNKATNFSFENNLLVAESGATIADLINASLDKELSGLEHFAGIPSTVGGACWQNLHFLAPDRESTIFLDSVVKSALVLENGKEKLVPKEYFKFGYDDSILHHNKDIFVLEVTFELKSKNKKLIAEQITSNLKWRNEKQPQLDEFPSCGSVFKKIEGIGAGRLIDKCGLKGKQIGGAMVSPKHANYIVNTGRATAQDVRNLIELVQKEVLNQTSFKLEPEISFIGEF